MHCLSFFFQHYNPMPQKEKGCSASIQANRWPEGMSNSSKWVMIKDGDRQKEKICKGDKGTYIFQSPTFHWTNPDTSPLESNTLWPQAWWEKGGSLTSIFSAYQSSSFCFSPLASATASLRVFLACSESKKVAVHSCLRQPSGRCTWRKVSGKTPAIPQSIFIHQLYDFQSVGDGYGRRETGFFLWGLRASEGFKQVCHECDRCCQSENLSVAPTHKPARSQSAGFSWL